MSSRIVRSLRVLPTIRSFARQYSSQDPYVLPLSHEAVSRPSMKETPLPPRIERENESIETLRARLVYQSRKRGMLEGDLLLSTFASENLSSMTQEELLEYDRLLDEPDWDIYYWSTEKKEPPARWANTKLLHRLRVHTRNDGKVVRKMPDLQ